MKKDREKAHVTSFRNAKGRQMLQIFKTRTYDHLYANKLANLGKTDKLLEKHGTRRRENLNSQISNKEL